MSRAARCNTVDWNWMEFLFDARVQAMTNEELGAWVRVLGALALAETPGRLPEKAVRRAAALDEAAWPTILGCLERDGETLVHLRTERDHRAQTRRVEQTRIVKSEAGKRSAAARREHVLNDRPTTVQPPSLLPSYTPTLPTPTPSCAAEPREPDPAERPALRLESPPTASGDSGATPGAKRAPTGWAEFWKAYPRKRSKLDAEKAYSRALKRGVTPERIMAGLARAKADSDWLKNNGKFIPYAASWLNDGGYDDEATVRGESAVERFIRGES